MGHPIQTRPCHTVSTHRWRRDASAAQRRIGIQLSGAVVWKCGNRAPILFLFFGHQVAPGGGKKRRKRMRRKIRRRRKKLGRRREENMFHFNKKPKRI